MGVYRRGRIFYIRYKDPHGQDIRESTEQESKRLAESILAKRKTEIAENRYLDRQETPTMTVEELCDWYWEVHGQFKKSHGMKGMLSRIKEFFGSRPIVAVTPELVGEFVSHRQATGATPRTTNKDLQLLKAAYNRIIQFRRWRKVVENPVSYLKLAKENNTRVRYLTEPEVTALLGACDDHLRPIVITALRTGMRRGEILNLQWQDVDFGKRLVFIRQSKNGESRYVPISDDLLSVLASLPSRKKHGFVFPSFLPRRGERRSGAANEPFVDIKNSFRKALRVAKVTDFRFHDLRHTFASALVMQGVDLNTVRELLGHKSLAMTLRYAHLSPDHNRAAIQVIDKALGPVECHTGGTATGTGRILKFKRRA